MSEETSVIIADDHAVVRKGLRLLIDAEPGLKVVAEAGTVPDAMMKTRALRAGVLILDLNMPGGSSLEAIPQIREQAPMTAIVVLTMQNDPAFARQALQSGAAGFVLKEAADDELLEAIRQASNGGTYLNPTLGARLAAAPPEPAGPPDDLSEREVGPAPDRAGAHEQRDREHAAPQRADRRVASRAHPAEDAALVARGARALRARARPGGAVMEIVIAGGGVAGLEALLALHGALGDRAAADADRARPRLHVPAARGG